MDNILPSELIGVQNHGIRWTLLVVRRTGRRMGRTRAGKIRIGGVGVKTFPVFQLSGLQRASTVPFRSSDMLSEVKLG